MGFHADHVGEEVPPGKGEVLDDQVERLVRVLDARDGDVADLKVFFSQASIQATHATYVLDEAREDDLADIHPQLGLPLQRALRIEQTIARETRTVLAKSLIEWILPDGADPVSSTADEVVKMTAIPLVVEHASVLAELLRTVVASIFKDIARLEKYLDVRCVRHMEWLSVMKELTLRMFASTSLNQLRSSSSFCASS